MDAPNPGAPPAVTPETPVSPPVSGPSFFAGLPDDLKALPSLAKFEKADHATFAKSYVELEKKLGERQSGTIKPLTAESTPEEIAAFRSALGVPEKPDGYDFGELSFPEAVTPTAEQLGAFRGIAHELHLTPAQVKGIMSWYSQDVSEQWNAITEARTAETKANLDVLAKKYGSQAPALVQSATEYVKRRFGQEGLDAFEAGPGNPSALGNNPVLLDILIESARLTGHDKFIVGDGRGGLINQESAKAKIQELYVQRNAAANDEAKKVIDRQIMELQPIAFG